MHCASQAVYRQWLCFKQCIARLDDCVCIRKTYISTSFQAVYRQTRSPDSMIVHLKQSTDSIIVHLKNIYQYVLIHAFRKQRRHFKQCIDVLIHAFRKQRRHFKQCIDRLDDCVCFRKTYTSTSLQEVYRQTRWLCIWKHAFRKQRRHFKQCIKCVQKVAADDCASQAVYRQTRWKP